MALIGHPWADTSLPVEEMHHVHIIVLNVPGYAQAPIDNEQRFEASPAPWESYAAIEPPPPPVAALDLITIGEKVRVGLSLPAGVVPSKLVPMIHGVLPPRIERLQGQRQQVPERDREPPSNVGRSVDASTWSRRTSQQGSSVNPWLLGACPVFKNRKTTDAIGVDAGKPEHHAVTLNWAG